MGHTVHYQGTTPAATGIPPFGGCATAQTNISLGLHMASWADRVRRAELEDLELLDAPDRLEFEHLLQWLRLSFLATPLLVLLAFGTAALTYALAIGAAVFVSYAWIAALM